jgi:flagellar protein FliS
MSKQAMRGLASYQSIRVDSAPPEQILVMIFQAILLRLEAAIDGIEAEDRKAVHIKLHEARTLFGELLSGLDDEAFPELCSRLRRLYGWCIREVIAAEREQSPEMLRGVMAVAESLLQGWEEAARQISEGAA